MSSYFGSLEVFVIQFKQVVSSPKCINSTLYYSVVCFNESLFTDYQTYLMMLGIMLIL